MYFFYNTKEPINTLFFLKWAIIKKKKKGRKGKNTANHWGKRRNERGRPISSG